MSECNHRWAIRNGSPALLGDLDSKSQEVFCLKCGKTVNDLLYAKDRQLDAAARDINELMQECPRATYECKISDCDECEGKDDYSACWRKRWEGISNE